MLELKRRRPGQDDEIVRLPEPLGVMNFTGEMVRILDGYGAVLTHEGKPLEYRWSGKAELERKDVPEAAWPEASDYEIVGLPEPVADMKYLVTWQIAEMAKRLGRTLEDLLIPTQPCFSDCEDLILIGYKDIISAKDWMWCLL